MLGYLIQEYRQKVEQKLDEAFDAVIELEAELDPQSQQRASGSMLRGIHRQVRFLLIVSSFGCLVSSFVCCFCSIVSACLSGQLIVWLLCCSR